MNTKKKIAIYATNASQYHVPIYKALSKRENIDLTVLYATDIGIKGFFDEQSNAYVEWDIDLSSGYKYRIFDNLANRKSRSFFRAVNFSIVPWVIKANYDLILIQGYNTFTSWLVFFAAKIAGSKLVWRGESIIPRDSKKPIFNKIKELVLKKYFRYFDYIFYTCTGNMLYLKQYIKNTDNMRLFPCAVDNNYFSEIKSKYIQQRPILRKKYSIYEDDIVILFAARFIKRKRPYDLIKAVSKMNDGRIVLMFCGDGPEKLTMEEAAEKLTARSIFTGLLSQEELGKHYLIADIYTILSDYDASPKTLNEAINFDLPIIASDMLGNAPDLVIDDNNGFIVQAGDVKAIQKKLEYLLDNIEKMKRKSMLTSGNLLKNWSIEKDVEALESILE